MFLLIVAVILLIILFLNYKNILEIFKKLFSRKINVIIIFLLVLFVIGYKPVKEQIKANINYVDKDKIVMVEQYLYKNFNMEGKIKASTFTHNIEGFTGGLFQYYFQFKDNNGKKYQITYLDYADLSQDTVDRISVEILN